MHIITKYCFKAKSYKTKPFFPASLTLPLQFFVLTAWPQLMV